MMMILPFIQRDGRFPVWIGPFSFFFLLPSSTCYLPSHFNIPENVVPMRLRQSAEATVRLRKHWPKEKKKTDVPFGHSWTQLGESNKQQANQEWKWCTASRASSLITYSFIYWFLSFPLRLQLLCRAYQWTDWRKLAQLTFPQKNEYFLKNKKKILYLFLEEENGQKKNEMKKSWKMHPPRKSISINLTKSYGYSLGLATCWLLAGNGCRASRHKQHNAPPQRSYSPFIYLFFYFGTYSSFSLSLSLNHLRDSVFSLFFLFSLLL